MIIELGRIIELKRSALCSTLRYFIDGCADVSKWMSISAFRSQQPRLPVNDERILQ